MKAKKKLTNFKKWLIENNIIHEDPELLKILNIQARQTVGAIANDGIKKVEHLKALKKFTGLSYEELLDEEVADGAE